MFFREKNNQHTKQNYLQLVENYRYGNQVKQKVIVSLGSGFDIPKESRKQIAQKIEERLLGQETLFEDSGDFEIVDRIIKMIHTKGNWDRVGKKGIQTNDEDFCHEGGTQTAEIIIEKVNHSHSRELGPLLVGDTFFQRLGFESVLEECGFSPTQINTAKISILNRLISQDSEYAIPSWIKTTAVEDIITLKAEDFKEDRFYRISDKLLSNLDFIEDRLYEKQRNLFGLNNAIFLYDLTNSYFEGICKGNPKAAFNKNQKEKRTDCRQIVIALVIDQEGFIRKHHVFGGKKSDASSLEEILDSLEKDFKQAAHPTIIMDRGIVSKENIELIRSRQLKYIIASRKNEELEYIEDFQNGDFKTIQEEQDKKIEILKKQGRDETIVLCKSKLKKMKEKSMRNQAQERFEADMKKINDLIVSGRRTDPKAIERMIGRKIQTHSKVASYYQVDFEPYGFHYQIPEDKNLNIRLLTSLKKLKEKSRLFSISHSKVKIELDKLAKKYPDDYLKINIQLLEPHFCCAAKDEKKEQLSALDGNYLLKTNRDDLSDEKIWSMYVMLTRIEAAFRNLKTDLGLRPNYHHLEKRVEGHVFISILAYHLLHAVEYTLRGKGCHSNWSTIQRVLSSHCYSTISMPTVKSTVIHLRQPGIPEPVHVKIYEMLDINFLNLPRTKSEV